MADQDVLGFLNQPISEKKAPPEDPVLSFLNRPIPGAEPPAPAAQAPAWVAEAADYPGPGGEGYW